jgi:hypothetical protein
MRRRQKPGRRNFRWSYAPLGRLVGIELPLAISILQVTDYTLPQLPARPYLPYTIARYCTPEYPADCAETGCI